MAFFSVFNMRALVQTLCFLLNLTLPTNAALGAFSTRRKDTEALCWNFNPLFVRKQSDRTAVVSVPAVLRVSFHFKTENSSSETTERWVMPPLTPPLPPQFVQPTLWDRRVRQRHNAAFISSLILTHTHTHAHCVSTTETTAAPSSRKQWRTSSLLYDCGLTRSAFHLFAFCQLIFFLQLPPFCLLSSLTPSCLVMTQKCAKTFFFFFLIHTLQCGPISHIGVYTRISGDEPKLPHNSGEGGWWRESIENNYMWG